MINDETTRMAPISEPDTIPIPKPNHGARKPVDRLHEIDLLRIIAAVAVVFYHYTFEASLNQGSPVSFPALSQVSRYGYLGVDMFFVISGFVVLLSAWNRSPKQFVISRIVRLYPAYWAAVTITAIVCVTLSLGQFKVSLVQYLANLTMLNGPTRIPNVDVVYWTLWAELRFYLLIFVFAFFGITRGRVIAMCWVWLGVTFILEAGVLPTGINHVLDLLVQSTYSHYFIAGMALCLIYRFGFSWMLGAIIIVAFGNSIYRGIDFAHAVSTRYHSVLYPAAVIAIITAIFCVITLIALRVTRRFAKPWFAHLGALTYPLYLIHAYIGFIIFHRLGGVVNPYLLLVGTIALMSLVAYMIHAGVERPFAPVLKRALTRVGEKNGKHRQRREGIAQEHQ